MRWGNIRLLRSSLWLKGAKRRRENFDAVDSWWKKLESHEKRGTESKVVRRRIAEDDGGAGWGCKG